jgi:hypothetical protein
MGSSTRFNFLSLSAYQLLLQALQNRHQNVIPMPATSTSMSDALWHLLSGSMCARWLNYYLQLSAHVPETQFRKQIPSLIPE